MEVGSSSILLSIFLNWSIVDLQCVSIRYTDSNIYLHPSICYYKILNIIPCAMQ